MSIPSTTRIPIMDIKRETRQAGSRFRPREIAEYRCFLQCGHNKLVKAYPKTEWLVCPEKCRVERRGKV